MKLKKRKIIVSILFVLGLIMTMLGLSLKNNYKNNQQYKVKNLNEDYFELEFDVHKNEAIIDGHKEKITSLFKISDSYLNELAENNSFKNFVGKKLIGDIEENNNIVKVNNPYSSKSLIVKTSNKGVFDDYKNIKEITETSENHYVIDFNNATDTKQAYFDLKNDSRIDYVVKDLLLEPMGVSDSTNMAWGVKSTGMDNYSKMLNYRNNKIVKVAVIDTGFNVTHEAFKINDNESKFDLASAYNSADGTDEIVDYIGHGTMVAGVIAESTPDNVKIVPVKSSKGTNKPTYAYSIKAIKKIYKKVSVINFSSGFYWPIIEESAETLDSFRSLLDDVKNYGTFFVTSAGNESIDIADSTNEKGEKIQKYPANFESVLTASAINSNNTFCSDFSNYGDEVDFAMPGKSLILPKNESDTSYGSYYGTSFSSPFLASAVALVKTEHPEYTYDEVVNFLKNNSDDLGTKGKDIYYGYGTINFNNHMFSKPVIANINVDSINWGTSGNLTINAMGLNKIKSYAVTKTNKTPSSWTNLATEKIDATIKAEATNNGTNYVWLKDALGKTTSESVEVIFVDNINPVLTSFTNSAVTNTTFTLKAISKDNESGISQIKWYYKKSSATSYKSAVNSYGDTSQGLTGKVTKSHTFKNLASNTEYNAYAEIYDLNGNFVKTEEITIKTLASLEIINKTNELATVLVGENSSTIDTVLVNNNETITLTSEKPCNVIATYDADKTYTRLEAKKVDNNYNYTVNINVPLKIYVVLSGDINMDGALTESDSEIIKKSKLSTTNSNYQKLSKIENIIADVDKNGKITSHDALLIKKSLLKTTNSNYASLNW